MSTKTVTIHYRRVEDDTRHSLGRSLQAALTASMNYDDGTGIRCRADWNKRAETLADGGTRFLNNYDDDPAALFGTLLLFEQNAMQALISNMGHVANVNVEQLPPDPGRQFLQGILYWLVVDDHIFSIQSSALRLGSFEDHMGWLLRHTAELPPKASFGLRAEFDRHAIGDEVNEIRRVAVHGRMVAESRADQLADDPELVEREREKKLAQQRGLPVTKEKAKELLRALFPAGDTADRLYAEIPEDGELDYNFELMLRTRDLEARQRFHRSLERDLRDADEGQVRLVGRDGSVSGDDIRLHMPMPVEVVGNLLDPVSARQQMLRVYQRFIEDGKIEPHPEPAPAPQPPLVEA